MIAAHYPPSGIAHAAAALVALLSGAWVLLTRKGTPRHVRVGWLYVASTIWVDGSALAIRHLNGRLNFFHLVAAVNLLLVLVGVAQIAYRHRVRRWLWRHYQYMCWSYVAVLAATVNEACIRVASLRGLTAASRGLLPLLASGLIVLISAKVIARNQRRLLAQFSPQPTPQQAAQPTAQPAPQPTAA